MQRRTFVSMAAGATMAFALGPGALASEQELKRPVAYPDPAVEVVDPRFAKYRVISAAVERLYTGARRAEGPVWIGEGFPIAKLRTRFVLASTGSTHSVWN